MKPFIRLGATLPLLLLASNAALGAPDPRETPVVVAVRTASPAVVNISTEIPAQPAFGSRDPFFRDFFRDFFGEAPPSRQRTQTSLGSGVLIRPDGTILTNEHVVANASRVVVTRASGEEYEARVVGADTRTDLAVLKVDTKDKLPYVKLGTSSDLLIGETVIAIGNPFGLSHTVTTGVVSALNRTIRGGNDQVYNDFIQTDASINPGNSGGPLLNIRGELIGINTAIYQKAEGIGFAIPVDRARRIVENLIAYGKVRRAWLGVTVQEVTPELARHFAIQGRAGVLVNRVFEGSPADEAGLERGDVVISIAGEPLRTVDDYLGCLAGLTVGNRFPVRLLRNGAEKELEISTREISEEYAVRLGERWLGLAVASKAPPAPGQRGAEARGLLIGDVRQGSAAAKAGIRAADVLREINNAAVDDLSGYTEALLAATQGETVVLVVQRGRVGYYVSLNP